MRQRADRYSAIGKPKSESGERSVPLTPIVANTLREWKLACPKSEQGLVFPSSGGIVEHHSNIVTRGLGPTQIAAGVTGKEKGPDGAPIVPAKYPGLHALRHFYASGASTGAPTAASSCRRRWCRNAWAIPRS